MNYRDIVAQLQTELPKFETRFSDQISFSSLIAVSTTITATTTVAHGKTTGDAITITGVRVENPVILSVSGTTVTGTTSFDHDLTEFDGFGSKPDFATVTISGTNETEYNGTFNVVTVPNRRTFTYELPATPSGPPTGSSILEEDLTDGYNGRFIITVTGATTFTYIVANAPAGLAIITGAAATHTKTRISIAINADRIFEAYTKQPPADLWLFVIPRDTTISNDRDLLNDATVSWTTGTQERKIKTIINFDIMVIFPATTEIAAAKSRDDAEKIAVSFYQSLAGFKPSTTLVCPSEFVVTPTGHGFGSYNGAVYAHLYNWQLIEEITNADTFRTGDRAFRDARLIFTNDFDENIIDTNVDLDDQPLP